MINVRQFYKFQLECSKPFIEISPGDQFHFQLTIRNEGNDQDTVRVGLDPKTERQLDDMGWAIMFPASEYVIDAGSEQVIKISVMPKQQWNLWKNEVQTIKVKIYSFQALSLGEIPVETTYGLYVRERGYSAPGYEMYLVVLGLFCIGFGIARFIIAHTRAYKVPKPRSGTPFCCGVQGAVYSKCILIDKSGNLLDYSKITKGCNELFYSQIMNFK